MSKRSDTVAGTFVLIALGAWAFYLFSDHKPSSPTTANRYTGMMIGKTFVLPETSRPYGCKTWDAVEAIESEAGRMGGESASRMAARYIAKRECVGVRPGDTVLISGNGVTSFQFRLPGSDQDYWAPKAY